MDGRLTLIILAIRCLGVLLKFLESERYRMDKLTRDIVGLEVSNDVADRIIHQLPVQDEVKMYFKYEYTDAKPVEELTDEDKLMLNLCKIERLGPRLEIVLFMCSFDDTMSALCPKIAAVNLASESVKKSDKLKKVLEIILAFGNYMNSARRGIAYGFRMQSLDALAETKSPNKRWTLLNYIVDVIEHRFPKCCNFYDELEGLPITLEIHVANCFQVPLESLNADVKQLEHSIKLTEDELLLTGDRSPPRLKQFLDTAEPRVRALTKQSEAAKNAFAQAVEWFGEAVNNPSPEQFFGILTRFKALADNEKRRRAESLKQRRSSVQRGEPNTDFQNGSLDMALSSRGNRRQNREEASDLQKRIASEAKMAQKRLLNRTRQIDADNIMDDIMA
ncbi:Formin-like protein 3, partial [Cichlidogyrus casuarinus]